MKKLVCLLLALLMVLSVAVACSPKEDDNDGDPTTEESTTGGAEVTTEGEKATTEPETEETTEPEEEEEPIVMKDYNIADFKIVYSGVHNLSQANSLQSKIKTKTGVELEIVSDDGQDNGGCEFIIGNADREVSTACFDYKNNKYMDCKGILCDNGKVQILGVDDQTIKDSIIYFINKIVKKDSQTINIAEKGALCEKINLAKEKIYPKADESYIRIVTNNILQEYIAKNTYKLTEETSRISQLIGAYALLDADIMGFQEVDPEWYTNRNLTGEMEKLGYSFVPSNNNKIHDKNVLNPIYYKTDRFTLLDGGYVAYSTTYEARWYTWAVLEEKTTGKQLIVANTHLAWAVNGYGGSSEQMLGYRNECARQLVQLIESKKAVYPNAAGIVMGDLNSYLGSEVCSILGASLNSARDTSEEKVNMTSDSDMSKPDIMPSKNSKVIDHIYYTKTGITAKRYEVSVSKYTYAYSDHVPVLFDIVLN